MRISRFQLFQSEDRRFYFRLQANSGKPVLTSQSFKTKTDALQGIAEVIKFGREEKHFSRRLSANFQYYFVLKNRVGKSLGVSPMFENKCEREDHLLNLKIAILRANVQDLS